MYIFFPMAQKEIVWYTADSMKYTFIFIFKEGI